MRSQRKLASNATNVYKNTGFPRIEKKESAGEIAISAKVELPRHGQGEKMHRVSRFLNVLSLWEGASLYFDFLWM